MRTENKNTHFFLAKPFYISNTQHTELYDKPYGIIVHSMIKLMMVSGAQIYNLVILETDN